MDKKENFNIIHLNVQVTDLVRLLCTVLLTLFYTKM